VLTPGFLVGASLTIGYLLGSSTRNPTATASEDVDGEVEEVSDRDLSAITAGLMEPCKMVRHFSCWCLVLTKGSQVLVVRTDLKMTNGEIAAR
jgi:hypothetical protein